MTKALDIVVNLWNEEVTRNYPEELDQFWDLITLGQETTHKGISLDEQIRRMDAAGVGKGLMVATTGGDVGSRFFFEKHIDIIHRVCQEYPDRFKGIVGINPSKIMEWMGKLEKGVREYGFVGAHIYPHWFGKAPDDRIYYPFYAKCAELGVPVQIQVGHSAQWFLETVGHPMTLDKAENGVLVVERWILFRLRKRVFTSLAELNAAIRALLAEANARPFQKLPGSRENAFDTIDRPAMQTLPAAPYEYAEFRKVRVGLDYHVEVDGVRYSVPFALARREVELRRSEEHTS